MKYVLILSVLNFGGDFSEFVIEDGLTNTECVYLAREWHLSGLDGYTSVLCEKDGDIQWNT